MTATVPQFIDMLANHGSYVTYHREEGGDLCPCRTPEGFRDPAWHRANPTQPVCNEQGYLAATITEHEIKAAIQPAIRGQSRSAQRSNDLLGDVQRDDKLGIFPCEWDSFPLDFDSWSEAGEDYILYDDKRYMVVSADKLPDTDGDPNHHWECGLRLVKSMRPV